MDNASMQKWNLSESHANEAMSLKTWWAMPFIQPLARKLVVFLVNRTQVTANQVTFSAIGLRLITATCFFYATRSLLVVGALAYYLAYVCDCADGTIARIKDQKSEFGRYLDHVADLVGDALILTSLCWSSGLFGTYLYAGMLAMQVGECYVSYLTGYAILHQENEHEVPRLFRAFNRYRNWWFDRNLKSFFSLPDYMAVVFVFFPLLGRPALGLTVGFWFLFVVVAYAVLSTFVSIHSGMRQFP